MKLILKHLGKIVSETALQEGKTYLMGRKKDCDFILEDETLSREHIKVYQSEETQNWIIECISEKGGLYFEAEEVEGLELEDSAMLSLKSYTLEFVAEKKQLATQDDEKSSVNLPVSNENKIEKTSETVFQTKTKMQTSESLIHFLRIYVDNENVDHVDLSSNESWILGRSEECDIYVDYKILSREHLKITKSENKFTVEDLGSSNGSLLNKKDMAPKKVYPLEANDTITIGELNIVFEVRNTEFDSMMNKLPAIVSEDAEEDDASKAIMPFPKVVLEDITAENGEDEEDNTPFLNKKRLIMFSAMILFAGAALWFGLQNTNKGPSPDEIKRAEKVNAIKKSYELAAQFSQQKNYQFCIDELNRLHSLTPYYLDSKQILNQCKTASENQKREEMMAANEKKKKETEEKVKKMAQECLSKEDTFETVEDVDACASKILQLEPENAVISGIKLRISEKQTALQLEREEKASHKKMIDGKKSLYNRAESLRRKAEKAGVGRHSLTAVSAYKRFLRSAKGIKEVSNLYWSAKKKSAKLQKDYDDTLNSLYNGCEKLMKNQKWKQAYYTCKNILKFKSEDEKAIAYMKQSKKKLRDGLKSTYEKSVLEESLSRIDTAQKLWQEIIEKDIKDGYYHKKASSLIKKYQ